MAQRNHRGYLGKGVFPVLQRLRADGLACESSEPQWSWGRHPRNCVSIAMTPSCPTLAFQSLVLGFLSSSLHRHTRFSLLVSKDVPKQPSRL